MSASVLLADIAALALLPLAWSALVFVVRGAALGSRNGAVFSDAHEKSVLAIMLAPIALAAALSFAPQQMTFAAIPPMPELFEFAAPGAAAAADGSSVAAGGIDWLLAVSLAAIALYLLGVARFAAPLISAHLRLRRWTRTACVHPLAACVYISERAPTPIAAFGKRVLLPRRLFEVLSDEQVRFIVAHERHHHARGDVAYYILLAWLDVLLWFNPFVRAQARNCRLAAELDCDAAVTAASPEMRRAYAETLLLVLKHTAGDALPCAPAVFSHRAIGDHRMRIVEIMKPSADVRKRLPWLAYVAALALAAPLAIGQLALAQSSDGEMPAASAAPVFSHVPVAGRLSSGFGERVHPITGQRALHSGADIAAPEGDPIVAPADGRVRRIVRNHEGYGNFLEIDHGGGYALRYAQVSAFEVDEGEQVRAGQTIARVGSSGRATGPHLHLEVWRDGRLQDPAQVLRLPSAQ